MQQIDISKPLFRLFDSALYQRDVNASQEASSRQEDGGEHYKSLQDIIKQTMLDRTFGSVCLYSIRTNHSHDLESLIESGELQFFEIKVLKRTLNGNPVIEILIDEANSQFMSCAAELIKAQKKERLARDNYE